MSGFGVINGGCEFFLELFDSVGVRMGVEA
jgi:hypothetical protein